MSWKPEIDCLSAKVEATKCLVKGPSPEVISDPIPYSPFAGATAVEDRNGVSKYKAKDHSDARAHIRSILKKGNQHVNAGGRAIIWLDTNKNSIDKGKYVRKKSIKILVEDEFDLKFDSSYVENDVSLYMDTTGIFLVIIHNPLCYGVDSRQKIPKELKVRRGLTIATLCNISRRIRGESFLSPDVKHENPVAAMIAMQIVWLGLHQNGRPVVPLILLKTL
jgi:hypothetical protein